MTLRHSSFRGIDASEPPTTQGMRYVPRVLVTDRLASYGPAHRVVMPSVEHR